MADGRGRAAGSIAALAVLLLAGMAIYALTPGGAPTASFEQAPTTAADGAPGHVYPARLMSEHPMYPMLLRLGRRIDSLCETADLLDTRQTESALQALAVTLHPPVAPSWDVTTLGEFLAAAMPPATFGTQPAQLELAPDLKARMRWIERTVGGELERKLEAARYEQELTLARRRAELVRSYQEALMNADIPPARQAGDADASARTGRARLEADIEARMQEARLQAEAEFARQVEQIRHAARESVAAAERDIAAEMRARQETSVSSGSKIVDRLSNSLSSVQGSEFSAEIMEWAPHAPDSSTAADSPARASFDVIYQAAAARVADDIGRRRLQLSRAIYNETVLMVRKCALQEGIELNIPPLQPADGRDLTEDLRPVVRRAWAAEGASEG